MIPLSPRLLCCASMVAGDYVCDIGTDHAYLPAYLVMTGKCRQALATDIKQGPLDNARGTLTRYRVSQSVKLLLSNGFEKVDPKGITDVVIAGMGGETIRDILSSACAQWLTAGTNLILQPMTRAEVLREWLPEHGFVLTKEVAVRDAHIYTVMQAHFDGNFHSISKAETYCGMLRKSEMLTTIYIAEVQKRLHTKAHGLEDAGNIEEALAVRELIDSINDWLRA